MLLFDKAGWASDARITVRKFPHLKVGLMTVIKGIIVHQTAAPTAAATLSQYKNAGANGAHFLIDKDGGLSQTASILWKVQHVGPIKARCLAEHRCAPVDAAALAKLKAKAIGLRELRNSVPDRYPANKDALGIEIVGATIGAGRDPLFEPVNGAQNSSLKWLVEELRQNFRVPLNEIFRHPDVSRKDPHEAETARW